MKELLGKNFGMRLLEALFCDDCGHQPGITGQKSEGPFMKRFVLTGCVFLLVVPLLLTACWPFPGDGGSGCQSQYVYDDIADQGQMLVVTAREQVGNNTGSVATLALTADRSTTVMVTAEAGVAADLGAIVRGVGVQLHVTVSESVTASISNSPTITIPAGEFGYGDYGVFVEHASGHLYSPNCGQDYGAHVTSRVPLSAGWCLWVTGESNAPCESSSPTLPAASAQGTCIQGYVWREAVPGDHVCVTPETRAQAQYDNSQAPSRIDPNGAYGPDSCIQGYVWREAVPGDHVCVTPETRAQAWYDNSQAPSRVVPGG
jgi:hypothetical protein